MARRFALVAAADEFATFYGLTGWLEGEAISAAKKCFTAWLEAFGTQVDLSLMNVFITGRVFIVLAAMAIVNI